MTAQKIDGWCPRWWKNYAVILGDTILRSSRLRWWCYFSGRLEVVMMIDLPARIVKTQQCFLFLQYSSSKEHNLVMGLALPYNRLQITVVRMFMGQQKSINFFLARDYCSCPMALLGYIFSSKTTAKRLEEKHSTKRAKRGTLYYLTTIQHLQNIHNETQLLKNRA